MPIAISVALFGALGALSRYGVDLLIERHTDAVFPLSTSRHSFVALRYSHEGSDERPSKLSRLRHARTSVS